MGKYRVLWVFSFVVLLGVSIAFNLLLYRYADRYYVLLNEARVDPFGLLFYEVKDKEVNNDKARVVFFGDSRAEQWRVPEGIEDFVFINRGIGGQTSSQVIGRFEKHVLSLNPDVLIVQVCINDLKTIALFAEKKREVIDTCKRNITEIVEGALEKGISVVLTTVFPRGEVPLQRRLYWSADIDKAIVEVNGFIRDFSDRGVYVYDAWAVLSDDSGLIKTEYSRDTLHLNKEGYGVLNKGLGRLFEKFISGAVLSQSTQH